MQQVACTLFDKIHSQVWIFLTLLWVILSLLLRDRRRKSTSLGRTLRLIIILERSSRVSLGKHPYLNLSPTPITGLLYHGIWCRSLLPNHRVIGSVVLLGLASTLPLLDLLSQLRHLNLIELPIVLISRRPFRLLKDYLTFLEHSYFEKFIDHGGQSQVIQFAEHLIRTLQDTFNETGLTLE